MAAAQGEGFKALHLRCFAHRCKVLVPEAVLRRFVSAEDCSRLDFLLRKQYLAGVHTLSECPAPNCRMIVRTEGGQVSGLGFRCLGRWTVVLILVTHRHYHLARDAPFVCVCCVRVCTHVFVCCMLRVRVLVCRPFVSDP